MTLLGGWSGFWIVNGSNDAPRRPAPTVGPPMLTMCGRSNLGSPSSLAVMHPKFGCLTEPDGM